MAHPGGLSLFVGSTDGDYFASDDLGDSWTTIATGIAPVSKAGHHAMLRMLLVHAGAAAPRVRLHVGGTVLGVTSRVAAARCTRRA